MNTLTFIRGRIFPTCSLFFDNNRCKPIDLFDNWNKPWQYSESPPGMKFYNWIGEISRLASKTWPKCETKGTISFLVPFFVTELGSSTQTRDRRQIIIICLRPRPINFRFSYRDKSMTLNENLWTSPLKGIAKFWKYICFIAKKIAVLCRKSSKSL